MNFYKKEYKTRMKVAGDIAEGKFIEYAKKNNLIYQKYGFDRGIPKYYLVPSFVTCTPDFLVIGEKAVLVEAKGTGRADHIKIKQHDLEQLELWNAIIPVYFFLYDSHLDKHCLMWYNDLVRLTKGVPWDTYPDNHKKYYKIPKTLMEWK